MKKKIFFLSLLLFLSLGFAKSDVAEAAMHPWQKIRDAGSTCEVRAWTDYMSYSTRANTIDFYLESRGNCGTLSYEAHGAIYDRGLQAVLRRVTSVETGSFSFRTPVKKAKLNSINQRPATGPLHATLKKNGRVVGFYYSNDISFPR